MKVLEIYTDGGVYPNPGVGTFAYVIVSKDSTIKKSFFSGKKRTNNEMEMMAVISALIYCEQNYLDHEIQINTDSKYVEEGFNRWMKNWKTRGWRNNEGGFIRNVSLWKEIDRLKKVFGDKLEFRWVRGHNGHRYNEMVDQLCGLERKKYFKNISKKIFT